jgi:hypothetical protein
VSERLSEDDLANLVRWGATGSDPDVQRLVDELRARRAADLTAAEREALVWLMWLMEHVRGEQTVSWGPFDSRMSDRAFVALARVLGGGE